MRFFKLTFLIAGLLAFVSGVCYALTYAESFKDPVKYPLPNPIEYPLTEVRTVRPLPSISIKNDVGNENGKSCVRLTQLSISAVVNGKIATTTYDMIFESSCAATLEGELEFPLEDGQTVSGYALDVDGKMREGVVVDKTKARKTFESVVRRGVDPGLVEKTKGNNFKTRVYPLSKGHPRHVRISYNQEIKTVGGKLVYSLPLYSKDMLDLFSLKVEVQKPFAKPVVHSSFNTLQSSSFKENEQITLELKKVVLEDYLQVEIPVDSFRPYLIKHDKEGAGMFFYLSPKVPQPMPKVHPKSIAVVFDVSGSAANRDLDRELDFLQKYMERLGAVDVRLVTFSNCIHTNRLLSKPQFAEVEKLIRAESMDGATQMGLLNLSDFKEDEILLFSDGISNFGVKESSTPDVPLYAINTSLISDYANLRRLSGKMGDCIHLNELTVTEALQRVSYRYPRLKSVECENGILEDVYPAVGAIADENISICGKVSSTDATLVVTIVKPDGTEDKKTYAVKAYGNGDEDVKELDRIWAQKKLAALEVDSKKNRETIKELSLKYGLVSDYTSLIVLETLLDYVNYEIEPPAELREEYDRLQDRLMAPPPPPLPELAYVDVLEEEESADVSTATTAYGNSVSGIQTTSESLWSLGVRGGMDNGGIYYAVAYEPRNELLEEQEEIYSRVEQSASFPGGVPAMLNYFKTNLRYPEDALQQEIQGRVIVQFVVGMDGSISGARVVRPLYPSMDEEALRVVNSMPNWLPGMQEGRPVRSLFSLPILFRIDSISQPTTQTPDSSRSVAAPRTEVVRPVFQVEDPQLVEASVVEEKRRSKDKYYHLEMDEIVSARKVTPAYMEEIEKVPDDQKYARYLQLKKNNQTVVFFLDMADYFRSLGQKEVALRILSNIAELKLEDSEVVRSLGGKLMEYGEYELAVETYKDVLNMREEEPQSYRDLALAYEAVENYGEANRLLDTVTNAQWERFAEINQVSKYELQELNARMMSYDKKKVADGMDLRVVISWNTDNTDMDLWVVDPNDDACGYKNKETVIGGRISHDFTNGYGPEAFTLKKAIPGTYKVYVHYYGTRSQKMLQPVIVRVSIFRNYGRKDQTCEERMVTFDTVKGWILLNDIVVK